MPIIDIYAPIFKNKIAGICYFILIFVIIDLAKLFNRLFHFVNKDFLYALTHHNFLSLIVIVGSVVLLLFIGNIKYGFTRIRLDPTGL